MSGKADHPHRKKRFVNDCSMYFVRTSLKQLIKCDRHRIFIPTLGWVRIKEKGYFPWGKRAKFIMSGTLSRKANRYFVSVTVNEPDNEPITAPTGDTIGVDLGVDLGVEKFAALSDGRIIPNFNKTCDRIRFLEHKLKRLNRKAARKREQWKTRRKGSHNATKRNLDKTYSEIRKVNYQLDCLRNQFILDAVHEVTRTKPSYVVIEDLNVKGMLKNRHLAHAIKSLGFSKFKQRLIQICQREGIEVRIADRWFPSSKTCSACGAVKSKLPLSTHEFHCDACNYTADRDLNAALNLANVSTYSIAT